MNHRFQFRLSTMLIVVTIAACATFLFLPFSPTVLFGGPEMGFYADTKTATLYPQVFVKVQNNGHLPIWYIGGEIDIREFEVQGDLEKGERHIHSPVWSAENSWTCLWPNETVSLEIPAYELFDVAKLQIEFRDWKGRTAKCWSDEFDFSSVPVEGIAGTQPRSPAPIPQ